MRGTNGRGSAASPTRTSITHRVGASRWLARALPHPPLSTAYCVPPTAYSARRTQCAQEAAAHDRLRVHVEPAFEDRAVRRAGNRSRTSRLPSVRSDSLQRGVLAVEPALDLLADDERAWPPGAVVMPGPVVACPRRPNSVQSGMITSSCCIVLRADQRRTRRRPRRLPSRACAWTLIWFAWLSKLPCRAVEDARAQSRPVSTCAIPFRLDAIEDVG